MATIPPRATAAFISGPMHRWAFRFQFEPLFVSELAADSQKHARIRFLEFGASLREAIDLRPPAAARPPRALLWRGERGAAPVPFVTARLCHPERSRFSGGAKDLPLNRTNA
jgi:hypothetical protein